LRVFVSSALEELAAERMAARAAIEQLQLAPVMFESGARWTLWSGAWPTETCCSSSTTSSRCWTPHRYLPTCWNGHRVIALYGVSRAWW